MEMHLLILSSYLCFLLGFTLWIVTDKSIKKSILQDPLTPMMLRSPMSRDRHWSFRKDISQPGNNFHNKAPKTGFSLLLLFMVCGLFGESRCLLRPRSDREDLGNATSSSSLWYVLAVVAPSRDPWSLSNGTRSRGLVWLLGWWEPRTAKICLVWENHKVSIWLCIIPYVDT